VRAAWRRPERSVELSAALRSRISPAAAMSYTTKDGEKLLVLSNRADQAPNRDHAQDCAAMRGLSRLEIPTIELGGGSARCHDREQFTCRRARSEGF